MHNFDSRKTEAKATRASDLSQINVKAKANNETEAEAIANADAYLNNAGLPTYSEALAISNELLEALKDMMRRFGNAGDRPTPAEIKANAAIAKATGE